VSEPPAWWRRVRAAWRHVAAALVLVHLLAITLHALPSPGSGLNRRDWAQPTVRGEFEAWQGRLAAVGVELTVDELQDVVYDIARGYHHWHQGLTEPFEPYYRTCGTWQSWRMFVAPHRYPSRLQIRIRQDRRWLVVYEARSPTAAWRARQLDQDRMRSALFRYGWGRKYPRTWRGFVDWIARRAAEDFPRADKVQLRFASYRTRSPEEVRAGQEPRVAWHRSRVVDLEPLR
jgi:hypothetical protein